MHASHPGGHGVAQGLGPTEGLLHVVAAERGLLGVEQVLAVGDDVRFLAVPSNDDELAEVVFLHEALGVGDGDTFRHGLLQDGGGFQLAHFVERERL